MEKKSSYIGLFWKFYWRIIKEKHLINIAENFKGIKFADGVISGYDY